MTQLHTEGTTDVTPLLMISARPQSVETTQLMTSELLFRSLQMFNVNSVAGIGVRIKLIK